ncbi:MAG TPA: HAMP domain-containing sensor histidine kinase [Chitinophagaceae bacterium]|nr:HAMP domain-containing sensor histidine kinase [Chitinophagaceae bacterium]
MKSLVPAIFACLCSIYLHAQTKGYERYSENPPSTNDTASVNQLIKQAVDIYLQYPDSARSMAERALLRSKQTRYDDGIGGSFAAIGYTYWAQSYYAFSLYYLFNADGYLKGTKHYGELSMIYRMIARNYIEMEKYYEAQAYLVKSEANAALSKDNSKIALVYNESSLIDLRQKNYNGAWRKGNIALKLAAKYNDTLLRGIIYSRLGDILKETGKDNEVKAYVDSSYRWSLLSNNNRLRSMLLNDYADYSLRAKNNDLALQYANDASALADSTGNVTVKIRAASIIARCYHAKQDAAQELAYQVKYNLLQDSVNTEYRKKGFAIFQQFFVLNSKLHDMETEEHAALVDRERLRFQHIIIIVLIMFVVILLAGFITIYFLYKEKNRLVEQLADRNNAVTEQKNIIEQQTQHLTQLNDLKTKLFAVISHDLRTPISSLRSIMNLFQKEGLTEEQAVALLKRMLPALDAADLTLSNLLNWSVKQMSGLKLNQTSFALFPLAEEMQRVFDFALQQKNITLINNVPPGIRVLFDEQHLIIVLRNLVSNAIKFTPQNGTIVISSKESDAGVAICVQDNGQGISTADQLKLFNANGYFSTRGTSGEKGTGLGLTLCKELLELNGGSIRVESEQGKGSSFYINLTTKAGK